MQQGGPQYGVPPPHPPPPEMPSPFSLTSGSQPHILGGIPPPDHLQRQLHQQPTRAEAVPPISTRPPPPAAAAQALNFDELASGSYPDDGALAAGEEAERGGPPGNRWPRDETLALIKIRTNMDATFRDATLKGPLWEEISRKLADMGYARSAKKCKEKFENVHKYYKRTKEGRAGRHDGKSYRFFSELEALHHCSTPTTPAYVAALTSPSAATSAASAPAPSSATAAPQFQPTPISAVAPPRPVVFDHVPAPAAATDISFSTDTCSSSSSFGSDGEDAGAAASGGGQGRGRKRKRQGSGTGGKTAAFFRDLTRQVTEWQEAMQRRFLEAIEKGEQDRMASEEAWRRQEMERLAREREAMAHEHAVSASRDAAIISFLQKITGHTVQLPSPIPITAVNPQSSQLLQPPLEPPPPQQPIPPQSSSHHKRQQQQQTTNHQPLEVVAARSPSTTPDLVPVAVQEQPQSGTGGGIVSTDPASSSRWPKSEVHALIKLRSGMEPKYQDAVPKGPLWEEISAGMKRLGYINRSAKKCKEKWENINKYFKKVKESNKKRPDDAKTCPYFHELEALQRRKNNLASSARSGSGSSDGQTGKRLEYADTSSHDALPLTALPPPPQTQVRNAERNGGGGNSSTTGGNGSRGPSCNGDMITPAHTDQVEIGAGANNMMVERQHQQAAAMEDYDNSGDLDDDQTDDDEDQEQQKMAYKIEFQRPNMGGAANPNPSSKAAAAANSFLAMPMVQ